MAVNRLEELDERKFYVYNNNVISTEYSYMFFHLNNKSTDRPALLLSDQRQFIRCLESTISTLAIFEIARFSYADPENPSGGRGGESVIKAYHRCPYGPPRGVSVPKFLNRPIATCDFQGRGDWIR